MQHREGPNSKFSCWLLLGQSQWFDQVLHFVTFVLLAPKKILVANIFNINDEVLWECEHGVVET